MNKKPNTDAEKRVATPPARTVRRKATKTVPPAPLAARAKAPAKRKRAAKSVASKSAASKSPAPMESLQEAAQVESAPSAANPSATKRKKPSEVAARLDVHDAVQDATAGKDASASGDAPTKEAKSEGEPLGAAKKVRARPIAHDAMREAELAYWSADKGEIKAPLGDLRLSSTPEPRSSEAGAVLADSATVSPPKRARRGSAPPDGDDEIWSDNPVPTSALVYEEGSRLTHGFHGDRLRAAAEFGSSQSLLSTDYYFRQYGAHGMRSRSAEVDDFGFDPHVDDRLRPLLDLVSQRYFRVELLGEEQLPAVGRALMVANRGGTLPWDGLVLRSALRNARPELSPVRWLAEDSVIHSPFMGVVINRLGAVRACPENAERLLAQDRLVAVFPEGAQGSRKLFRDRYRLQRFGRGGYVKLALKLGVPIFPTAIIGAEETNPVLHRSRLLGRLIGSDTVPLTATFPWLGLAGLLPAPVRWRIAVGEPIDLSSYGPEAAEDALVVHRLNEQIRSALQSLVDEHKSARGGSLFG